MWPLVTLIALMTGPRALVRPSGQHSDENSAAQDDEARAQLRSRWQHVATFLGGPSKGDLNSEPVRIIREGTRMRGLRPSRVNAQR